MRRSEIQQGIATGIGEVGQEVTKTELENQKMDESTSDLQTFIRTGLSQRTW